jgi:hypothetical protein
MCVYETQFIGFWLCEVNTYWFCVSFNLRTWCSDYG